MAIDASVIKTGRRIKAPKISVYGVGGIGKTKLASYAERPIFLFTEDGQGKLDVARFEPNGDPVIRDWPTIIECVSWLYQNEHDFGTVVLDTADFAEPLLWKYTAAKGGQTTIEGFKYGKGYVYAADEFRVLLRWLDVLNQHKNMAIILLAHSTVKRFESPEVESYDRYTMRLHEKVANLIHDWSDAMLFANYQAHVVKDKESFGQERARGTGHGARMLYSQERPAFAAKNRYGLPFEMPLKDSPETWKAIVSAVVDSESQPTGAATTTAAAAG